ncbi:MAG: MFS transporter [Armatimonadetes bacterium]|nr:MFS transporter [Armatimonadota bacterium]
MSKGAAVIMPLLLILVGFEIGVSVFGPLLPQVQREFRVSAGSVALALSVYHGIRLLVNVPMGRLVARSALPAMLAAGGAILAAGGVAVALAPSFAVVLVGRAIMGVGSALFFITIQYWISKVATLDNKAQLFSYHQIAALTGTALGPALGGAVAGWLSWRYSLVLAVIAGTVALGAGRRLADPTADRPVAPAQTDPSGGAPLEIRSILGPGIIMMALFFFHGGVIATLIPLFSAREIHLGPAAIGAILMIGTIQRFGAALASGRLAGLFGTRRVILTGLFALGVSVLSFLGVGSPLGVVLAVSLVSWANLGGSLVIALVTDVVPEKHWGVALGINRTMADVGAMVAPLLVGFVIDQRGFGAAFVAAATVLLAATGLAAVLTAAHPTDATGAGGRDAP